MDRRAFLALLALGTFAAPWSAAAQPVSGRTYRIGFLSSTSAAGYESRVAAFRRHLAQLGYVEGRNFAFEFRWADGANDRLPSLAEDIAKPGIDLIVSIGTPATRAAQRATKSIPIVLVSVADPVGSGIVSSLARPGANITGVTNFVGDTTKKQLDILAATIPRLVRVAVLLNPGNASTEGVFRNVQAESQAMGLRPYAVGAQTAAEIEEAFALMTRENAQAFLVLADPFLFDQRRQITELAMKARLPAIYNSPEYAEAGGLMSYGVNTDEVLRIAATHVDKILRGTPPADIPVEQPTKFELVINLRTAKALGLTMSKSLLLRADEIIR
jgi:putative ABC transport system substrate-binding protein